ncbi:MAG: hypothetical protein ACE5EA_09375 [Nitrospirota bacterium]
MRIVDINKEDEIILSIKRLKRDQKKIQERIEIGLNTIKEKVKGIEKSIKGIQKIQANLDVKIEQVNVDIGIIQGKLERDTHMISEVSHGLEDLLRDFENEKIEVRSQLTEEGKIVGELSNKVEMIPSRIDEEITPLIESTDIFSKRFEGENASITNEIKKLKNRITGISKLIDSLGTKLTVKIDEQDRVLTKQDRLLKDTVKKVKKLEKTKVVQ